MVRTSNLTCTWSVYCFVATVSNDRRSHVTFTVQKHYKGDVWVIIATVLTISVINLRQDYDMFLTMCLFM